MTRIKLLFVALALSLGATAFGQAPIIGALSLDGELTATNLVPGSTATVEWAHAVTGPWTNSWAALDSILVDSNGTIRVGLPLFYRVRGFSPTNALLGLETSVPSLTVGEAGSGNFGVRLSAPPPANVTVTVASGDTGAATVSPPSLTFTPVNWNIYQTLTISGVDDPDTANESVTITLSAPSVSSRAVEVTVTDDDVLGIERSLSLVTVAESGSGTFTVRLIAQPPANTTVSLSSGDTGAATVSPPSLSFTPVNWNTPQMVTVSGVNDADIVNESVTITLSSSGLSSVTVGVTVIDDDMLGLETSVPSLTVGEAGSGNFGVRLTAPPPASVTVTVVSGDTGAATAGPPSLTFTPVNWNVYQTVTISGVSDPDTANESVTITLSAPSLSNRTVEVTVTDDD